MRNEPPPRRAYKEPVASRKIQVASQSHVSSRQDAMKLYVEPMDAVVVEVSADGRVRLENEDWRTPTLQEKRAIIYAATQAVEELTEVLDILDSDKTP
jgi:hypothetical protein